MRGLDPSLIVLSYNNRVRNGKGKTLMKRMFLFLISILLLTACKVTVEEQLPVEGKEEAIVDEKEKTTPSDEKEVTAPPKENEEEYRLKIKGESPKLSKKAWDSMQQWREDMYHFTAEHETVYLNGPNKKMVALTFDDGPDDVVTPQIIDILNDFGVKGSFFFIGSEIEKNREIVQKTDASGHLVLNHSYHHNEMTKLTEEEMAKEIETTDKAIEAIIGKKPSILRTPYGDTDERVVKVASEAGHTIVLWSIDTLDWSHHDANKTVKNVVENVRNGDIILMHSASIHGENSKALPILIEELKVSGFELVDLATLLNIDAYKLE